MEASDERLRRRGWRSEVGEVGGEGAPIAKRHCFINQSQKWYVATSILRIVPRSWDSLRKKKTRIKSSARRMEETRLGRRNLKSALDH